MLSIRNLSRPGLGPVDLSLAGGEIAALTGPSGAGKSLLLRAIADLDPNEGEVRLDGEARDDIPAPAWRRRVSYVAAESGWWADVVISHFENPAAAIRMLPDLGLDEGALNWPVSRLSTGEKQRLALIRSVTLKPKVMLLDEPTSGLDDDSKSRVEKVLNDLVADGMSLLIVTHDNAQAKRLKASVHRVEGGRLVEGPS
ncbi:MAG: ATP-binding cassette domain-containing protein [Rhodospirillaceae bacterium]|nr:ATP-binding cassette domain-containing protein [Rhodospirillaceae bacterium]